jgi:hypothetical protein
MIFNLFEGVQNEYIACHHGHLGRHARRSHPSRDGEKRENTDTVLEMERVMLGVSCTNSKLIRAEDYFYFIGKAKC